MLRGLTAKSDSKDSSRLLFSNIQNTDTIKQNDHDIKDNMKWEAQRNRKKGEYVNPSRRASIEIDFKENFETTRQSARSVSDSNLSEENLTSRNIFESKADELNTTAATHFLDKATASHVFNNISTSSKVLSDRNVLSNDAITASPSASNNNSPSSVEDTSEDITKIFSKVRHNHLDCIEDMFKSKALSPHVKDAHGNSLLHICAQNNLMKMSQVCVANGCRVNHRNKKGLTPLDYCDNYSFDKLGDWLVALGGENGHYSLKPINMR